MKIYFVPPHPNRPPAASGGDKGFERAKAMEVDFIITIAIATVVLTFIMQAGRIMRVYAMHKTVREALSRNSDLTADLLDRIERDRRISFGDGRIGIVLIAIAAALIVFGLIEGDPNDIRESAEIAIFPLFVGAALLGRLWYLRSRGEKS